MKARGLFQPVGTKNTNVHSSVKHIRRNSRQSKAAFAEIDFECTGNTNDVNHLIKSSSQAHRHVSNLNFELNLRTYRIGTNFTAQEPWVYPKANDYYDPVALDKPTFGHTMQLTKSSKVVNMRDFRLNGGDELPKRNLGPYLGSSADALKYSDKYRIKNLGELRLLLTKSTDQPTMMWSTNLRPNLGNDSSLKIKVKKPLFAATVQDYLASAQDAVSKSDQRRQCYCPPKF